MKLEPVGVVHSHVMEGVDEGWGEIVSEIHVDAGLAEGLRGLDTFSHAIIVFYMHQHEFDAAHDLVRRPRGRADMPELGCFAQRAKHRPNPIGITPVRVLGVAGNVLRVQGLDAIDGTPVLDIKPYFPAFDQVDGSTVPPWVDQLMQGYF